jgi:hypothetical protein
MSTAIVYSNKFYTYLVLNDIVYKFLVDTSNITAKQPAISFSLAENTVPVRIPQEYADCPFSNADAVAQNDDNLFVFNGNQVWDGVLKSTGTIKAKFPFYPTENPVKIAYFDCRGTLFLGEPSGKIWVRAKGTTDAYNSDLVTILKDPYLDKLYVRAWSSFAQNATDPASCYSMVITSKDDKETDYTKWGVKFYKGQSSINVTALTFAKAFLSKQLPLIGDCSPAGLPSQSTFSIWTIVKLVVLVGMIVACYFLYKGNYDPTIIVAAMGVTAVFAVLGLWPLAQPSIPAGTACAGGKICKTRNVNGICDPQNWRTCFNGCCGTVATYKPAFNSPAVTCRWPSYICPGANIMAMTTPPVIRTFQPYCTDSPQNCTAHVEGTVGDLQPYTSVENLAKYPQFNSLLPYVKAISVGDQNRGECASKNYGTGVASNDCAYYLHTTKASGQTTPPNCPTLTWPTGNEKQLSLGVSNYAMNVSDGKQAADLKDCAGGCGLSCAPSMSNPVQCWYYSSDACFNGPICTSCPYVDRLIGHCE